MTKAGCGRSKRKVARPPARGGANGGSRRANPAFRAANWSCRVGWIYCSMARVPTIAEEDAKRPNRERECLVGERTRIVNRIKSTLARLGIRDFKPTLRKAAKRLATVHTPDFSIPSIVVGRNKRNTSM